MSSLRRREKAASRLEAAQLAHAKLAKAAESPPTQAPLLPSPLPAMTEVTPKLKMTMLIY